MPSPRTIEREWFRDLAEGTVRTRMRRRGNTILSFTVQFEVWTDNGWRPAVRYDSAHGYPHRDTLDWEGRVIDKFWLPVLTNREALTYGERDIIANATRYRDEFMERRP